MGQTFALCCQGPSDPSTSAKSQSAQQAQICHSRLTALAEGRKKAMYHTIEFTCPLTADLEIAPNQPLERVRIRKGTRLQAQIRPSVVESGYGPVEVADLFFADGTTTRLVPFGAFSFVD
jgi:hypothetical protein